MNQPNVILMLVDDLGYGDLSCLNHASKIKTPNIDALADRGIVFRDAHATSALCTPSRYGLLTGRYNWRSKLKSLVLPGGDSPLIEPDRMTIADLFKQQGYATACVGKWHLGLGWARRPMEGDLPGSDDELDLIKQDPVMARFRLDGMDIDFDQKLTTSPLDYGFDYFYGTAASLDQPPYAIIENDRVLDKPDHVSGVFPLDRNGPTQQTEWQRGPHAQSFVHEDIVPDMNRKVLDLIDQNKDKPFFIYYPTHAVHGPLLPPHGFDGKSGLNRYADMVLYVDHMVGEITQSLKDKAIWDNTIFIFLSDNGCAGVADYPLLKSRGHNPSYIFRGKKSDIYEGGHRIPAIFSWPGQYSGRSNCDQTVCLSDLFRTFADLFDQELADDTAEDSFSLKPLLDGRDQPVRESIVHSSGNGSFSIRNKNWKLEFCPDGGGMESRHGSGNVSQDAIAYQLYNLEEDIGELKNLFGQHPKVEEQLKAELIRIIEQGRSTPGKPQANTPVDSWPQYDALKQ